MPVRAVVVPASPLLVPGAAGGAHVLGAARDLVAEALGDLLAGLEPGATGDGDAKRDLLVLASAGRDGARGPGSTPTGGLRRGRLRPSLAGAGIADRWLVRGGRAPVSWGPGPLAQVPASVALLCVAAAFEARGTAQLPGSLEVIEVPVGPVVADRQVVRDRVVGADAVVAAGGEADAAVTELEDAARHAGWVREVRSAGEAHEHLPGRYDVTVWRTEDRRPSAPTT